MIILIFSVRYKYMHTYFCAKEEKLSLSEAEILLQLKTFKYLIEFFYCDGKLCLYFTCGFNSVKLHYNIL